MRFSCLFKCSRTSCQEVVAVSGNTFREEVYDEEYGHGHGRAYSPTHFEPALTIYEPPSFVPHAVSEAICIAQALILSSSPSAGNFLRKALELLCDDKKVPRKKWGTRRAPSGSTTPPTKKLRDFPLHDRLVKVAKGNKEAERILHAVKWLGNSGTHADLTVTDVYDGLDLFEYYINAFMDPQHRTIRTQAKKINKNKGPLRGRK